ncbi:hypothetical protein EPA93_08010 [Ktedonosporobacter rubrisoli]|uniref:HTH luxR-type domain-containing protein n=1 Tax=Ktedonosporobacter rubrisoli TaxID=2509675 RepID=A0A4P6JL96_KTERU|nr:LuxR C-terminal-related transcriptional regulator [Ktedonosporobacter rubrisoli]QBD75954.1 hypothetical protein EPA93_08010 [Ktedonosporobacter rubrisoli]
MPRRAPYLLRWSSQAQGYELFGADRTVRCALVIDSAAWFTWLDAIPSFAFVSRSGGRCTVRKELIHPDQAYWYAYRSWQRRTVKRYLGRPCDLSLAHLEDVARRLQNPPSSLVVEGKLQMSNAVAPPSLQLSPLQKARLHPPRLLPGLIERTHLFTQLDTWHTSKLLLVSAPAGFGKTTLLASWLAARNLERSGWVSLVAEDNDLLPFWRMIFTACQIWAAHAAHEALTQLLPPTQLFLPHPSLTEIILSFCYSIAQQGVTGLLILDDYHIITKPEIHEMLSFFISHLPESLHLVLLTRADLPLTLARLRASGELHALQARDMRFAPDEVARFFQLTSACSPSPDVLEELNMHLEGWPAGLRLFSLSLHTNITSAEIEHLLNTFRGAHRPVREYFVAEVLEAQPEPLQHFLLCTSFLPRLSASLCAVVTGQPKSLRFLEEMERANLFVEALDASGEWYRYQSLFAEAMQHEARRRLGEEVLLTTLHAASSWFQHHALLAEAIDTALKAEAFEQAALLIEQIVQQMDVLAFQEYHQLQRWLELMPQELVWSRPRLCFSAALALAFRHPSFEIDQHSLTRIEAYLHRAEEGWRAQNDRSALGELFAFRAVFISSHQAQDHATIWAAQALEFLPATAGLWRAMSLRVVSGEDLRAGRFQEAFRLLQESERCWQVMDNLPMLKGAQLFLGMICLELGELQQATRYFQQVLHQARPHEDGPHITLAQLGQAFLLYARNELEAAEQLVQRVLSQIKDQEEGSLQPFHRLLLIPLELLQARLFYARGEAEQAMQSLAALLAQLRLSQHELHSYFFRVALASFVHYALRAGDIASVQRWLDTLSPEDAQQALPAPQTGWIGSSTYAPPGLTQAKQARLFKEQHVLLQARLFLAQEAVDEALALLNALLPAMHAAGRKRQMTQIYVLLALAHAGRQQRLEARQSLLEALKIGYDESDLHTFLEEGQPLCSLLQDLVLVLRDEPLRAYTQMLLQAFVGRQSSQSSASAISGLAEPLSPQEQRVLRKLAAGLSNAEIAQTLTVSINTVRSQVQSIYRKLQVHNRHAAREVARRMHLC